jgi:CRISPR type I-E-associated protein CasB/Cse2
LAPLAEITREEDLMALALVAVSTARVKVDREGRFEAGVRLPKALRGREARPLFSELRLQRLLEERDPADLCRQLRRALAQVKGKADPRDVAHWAWGLAHPRLHDRTARAFAYAYYGAEAPGTPPSAPRDVDRVTGETPAIA